MVCCIHHVCVRVRQVMEVTWLCLRVKTHQPSYDSIFLWPLFTSMPVTAVVNKLTVLSVHWLSAFSSVTAEKWVPIIEVPVNSVKHFLEKKKRDGFSILGLEQTANSVPLDHHAFPKKTVSILNHSSQFLQYSVWAWKEIFICNQLSLEEKKIEWRIMYELKSTSKKKILIAWFLGGKRWPITPFTRGKHSVNWLLKIFRDVCLFHQFARYWSLDVKRRAYRWTLSICSMLALRFRNWE